MRSQQSSLPVQHFSLQPYHGLGAGVGARVGDLVGAKVGAMVGERVGALVVGAMVGAFVGIRVGAGVVGAIVGAWVGAFVGAMVGEGVGTTQFVGNPSGYRAAVQEDPALSEGIWAISTGTYPDAHAVHTTYEREE